MDGMERKEWSEVVVIISLPRHLIRARLPTSWHSKSGFVQYLNYDPQVGITDPVL